MRRKPYSVLLLDEIEKAHPDVFNILLQILEDGRLTDSQGRTVDFRNAIVIMTSNVGAKDIARNTPLGFTITDETGTTYEEMKSKITGELKKVFRPEFLNRIDEVIVFHKLEKAEIKQIIDLMISRVRAQVAEHELQLELTDEAKELLVEKGWDPAMGARPLRRAIQRYIEDPLADEVLRQGEITSGTTVLVDRDESGDEDDKPLSMKLVKPTKRTKKSDKEPVAVGAKKDEEDARRRRGRARRQSRTTRATTRSSAASSRGAAQTMSQENVEIVRHAYERFVTTGEISGEALAPDFVWDMSNFDGWPEQQVYEGVAGARSFLETWTGAWDDWILEVDALHDAGDKVVAFVRQSGTSKAAGMPVEMSFAQVWTVRDGREARMDMYSDRSEALEAAGLGE